MDFTSLEKYERLNEHRVKRNNEVPFFSELRSAQNVLPTTTASLSTVSSPCNVEQIESISVANVSRQKSALLCTAAANGDERSSATEDEEEGEEAGGEDDEKDTA